MSDSPFEHALVTGATGFIGKRLVQRLQSEGVRVRALVLPQEDVPEDWNGVEVVRGDVTDPGSVAEALEGVERVFHLVALVGDWGPEERFVRVTVGGTHVVLAEAARRSVRVVLVSSVVVYGASIGTHVCAEELPMGEPVGVYSRTKQVQEQLAWDLVRRRGLALTVVRPTNVYGPGSLPWVELLCERLRKWGPMLVGSGNQNAGLVYVDNVVDILVRAASRDVAIGRIYNACDELDVTWREYVAELAALIDARPPWGVPRIAGSASAFLSETLWSWLGREDSPPVSREGLNLIGSHFRVPAERARRELGHDASVHSHRAAMRAIAEALGC